MYAIHHVAAVVMRSSPFLAVNSNVAAQIDFTPLTHSLVLIHHTSRLGRWSRIKAARNGIALIPILNE